ncbi:MAG: hypothetical protein QOF51_2806 [Chloroflexota bacterium]|nr:hypothetical protein [Chloroflexota bacterium]
MSDTRLRDRLGTVLGRLWRSVGARVVEPWSHDLNLSWITPQLAAGGAFQTAEISQLRRLGITAVVDCREEAGDDADALARSGIELLRLPTPDNHQLTQPALEAGVTWVNERLARGDRVFVHCMHGIGRGPLLGSCVLVSQGLSPQEALTTVKRKRWQAAPNEEQLDALLAFAERYQADEP